MGQTHMDEQTENHPCGMGRILKRGVAGLPSGVDAFARTEHGIGVLLYPS